MRLNIRQVFSIMMISVGVAVQANEPLRFEKRQLTDEYFCDEINHGDLNGDQKTDILTVSKLGTFVFLQN